MLKLRDPNLLSEVQKTTVIKIIKEGKTAWGTKQNS